MRKGGTYPDFALFPRVHLVAILDDPHVRIPDQLPHLLERRERGGERKGQC